MGAVGRGAGHRSMKLGSAVGGEGTEFVAVSAQGALDSAVWAEAAGGEGGGGPSSCGIISLSLSLVQELRSSGGPLSL